MLGKLNHVAIAVPDLARATALYRDTLGARVSAPQALPGHGVTVVFVELDNTKVELLEPLGADSPIAAFLARNPDGGMHHLCYEVEDIIVARDRAGKQVPYAIVGIIEKRNRATSFGPWVASRGRVIRGVSDLTYQVLKQHYQLA